MRLARSTVVGKLGCGGRARSYGSSAASSSILADLAAGNLRTRRSQSIAVSLSLTPTSALSPVLTLALALPLTRTGAARDRRAPPCLSTRAR